MSKEIKSYHSLW